ncbi:MAG: TetR/AcrR family transcriptional regulator [Candidatus Eremiobacteraeota bacterium]|nr:TetR/AcrR family transcriptional regulator [Candidatus Eremiobacteraeota bacterium]
MGRTSDARERLLDSALELISSRSYNDVGVQELCQHSGVKKGSFYHFFESKRELVLAVLDRRAEEYRADLQALFSRPIPPLEKIASLFDSACENSRQCKSQRGLMVGCCFGNLAVEMSTLDETIRARLEEIFEERVGFIQKALEEAMELGHLPRGDANILARSVMAFLQGATAIAKTRNEPELIGRMAQAVMDLFRGCQSRLKG